MFEQTLSFIKKYFTLKNVVFSAVIILAIFCLVDPAFAVDIDKDQDNCNPDKYAKIWSEKCFGCTIVITLIEAFMTGAAKAYTLSRDAAVALLKICAILWVIPFILNNVRSFTGVSASTMMTELMTFLFKVLFAYVAITIGIETLVSFFVNPLLSAGADFATAVLDIGNMGHTVDGGFEFEEGKYKLKDSGVISAVTMNKIMIFVRTASSKVADGMALGSNIVCYSTVVAPWGIEIGALKIPILPDMGMLLVGVFMWVMGFLLTLALTYYLLDIATNIGIMMIFLPLAIALWPFKIFKNKIVLCINIVLRAAGVFLCLAVTVSITASLIEKCFDFGVPTDSKVDGLGGKALVDKALREQNSELVNEIFSLWSQAFLIMMICYFYGMKLIGKCTSLTDKLFPGGDVSGGAIHNMATGLTSKAMAPLKFAKNVVQNSAHKALDKAVGGAVKFAGKATKFAATAPFKVARYGANSLTAKGRLRNAQRVSKLVESQKARKEARRSAKEDKLNAKIETAQKGVNTQENKINELRQRQAERSGFGKFIHGAQNHISIGIHKIELNKANKKLQKSSTEDAKKAIVAQQEKLGQSGKTAKLNRLKDREEKAFQQELKTMKPEEAKKALAERMEKAGADVASQKELMQDKSKFGNFISGRNARLRKLENREDKTFQQQLKTLTPEEAKTATAERHAHLAEELKNQKENMQGKSGFANFVSGEKGRLERLERREENAFKDKLRKMPRNDAIQEIKARSNVGKAGKIGLRTGAMMGRASAAINKFEHKVEDKIQQNLEKREAVVEAINDKKEGEKIEKMMNDGTRDKVEAKEHQFEEKADKWLNAKNDIQKKIDELQAQGGRTKHLEKKLGRTDKKYEANNKKANEIKEILNDFDKKVAEHRNKNTGATDTDDSKQQNAENNTYGDDGMNE